MTRIPPPHTPLPRSISTAVSHLPRSARATVFVHGALRRDAALDSRSSPAPPLHCSSSSTSHSTLHHRTTCGHYAGDLLTGPASQNAEGDPTPPTAASVSDPFAPPYGSALNAYPRAPHPPHHCRRRRHQSYGRGYSGAVPGRDGHARRAPPLRGCPCIHGGSCPPGRGDHGRGR